MALTFGASTVAAAEDASGIDPSDATYAARTSSWRAVAGRESAPRRYPSLMPVACLAAAIHSSRPSIGIR